MLLGPPPTDRTVRVMVTMPSEAAVHYELVRDLVAAVMTVMRINCAHDDAIAWERMVLHGRRAELGRPCRVLCDLAGPKLRTGPREPGPGVLHWWPLRDDTGRILARARIGITSHGSPSVAGLPSLPIDPSLLALLERGDELHFVDTRGRHRRLEMVECDGSAAVGEADRNAWILTGTQLELRRAGAAIASGFVGALPPIEQVLRLAIGDVVPVDCGGRPGRPAVADATGAAVRAGRIACTLPEVARDVRPSLRAPRAPTPRWAGAPSA